MTKRKLTQQQARRIRQKQAERNAAARKSGATFEHVDEQSLSEECQGRIVAHYGTQVDVEDDNRDTTRCFLRANLDAVTTGDWVTCRFGDKVGVVESLHPRTSLLSRPDSYGKLKPVAANVDQLLITIAPKPEFFSNLIDRYIVVAEVNNIVPLILINKCDLIDDENKEKFDALVTDYQGLGYRVLSVSAKKNIGLQTLNEQLRGKTSILVGQSGVGKSSILKTLLPSATIPVGDLSDAKSKGRHTTTHSQLFHFAEGGECIDSPGIREFGLWNLDKADVITGFIELNLASEQCKFRDCSHNSEPGCGIQRAITEGKISPKRFESYQRIIASLDEVQIKSSN